MSLQFGLPILGSHTRFAIGRFGNDQIFLASPFLQLRQFLPSSIFERDFLLHSELEIGEHKSGNGVALLNDLPLFHKYFFNCSWNLKTKHRIAPRFHTSDQFD